jgi:hypothetical protein
MTTTMSEDERHAFLAEARVAVISVESTTDRAPLAVPIWYEFDPAVGVTVVTARESLKGRALAVAGRYSLAVQDGALRYVSVDGPVVDTHPPAPDLLRRMARRYLGDEVGDAYADATTERDVAGALAFVMRPARWFSADLRAEIAALT